MDPTIINLLMAAAATGQGPVGTTWTSLSNSTITLASGANPRIASISIKGLDIVAVGQKYEGLDSRPMVLKSTDSGATWTESSITTTGSFIRSVTCSNTVFVLLSGSGEVYYSNNGANWNRSLVLDGVGPGAKAPVDLSYSGGMFILSCTNNGIRTSTDGISWSDISVNGLPQFSTISSITKYSGGYIAVGVDVEGNFYSQNTPYIASSVDGINWGVQFHGSPSSSRPVKVVAAEELGMLFALYGSALEIANTVVMHPLTINLGAPNTPTTVLTGYVTSKQGIVWTGSELLIVTSYGSQVIRSINGTSFFPVRDSQSQNFYPACVAYGNGTAIAGPFLAKSTA